MNKKYNVIIFCIMIVLSITVIIFVGSLINHKLVCNMLETVPDPDYTTLRLRNPEGIIEVVLNGETYYLQITDGYIDFVIK